MIGIKIVKKIPIFFLDMFKLKYFFLFFKNILDNLNILMIFVKFFGFFFPFLKMSFKIRNKSIYRFFHGCMCLELLKSVDTYRKGFFLENVLFYILCSWPFGNLAPYGFCLFRGV